MAQHYEVGEGESLTIHGPANIIVKTGSVPEVGSSGKSRTPSKQDAPEPEKPRK